MKHIRHSLLKTAFAIIFLLLLAFCSNKSNNSIKDLIEKQKMVELLVDINIAEAGLRFDNPKSNADSIKARDIYNKVFKKHNVTEMQFKRSMKYYSDNTDELGEIYDEVITILSRMQTEKKF